MGMHLAPTPAICAETILDLKRLLAHATSDSDDVNVKRRRHPVDPQGGASAKTTVDRAISVVSDALAEDSSGEGPTLGVKTADRSAL
jgi:hypothetical protein